MKKEYRLRNLGCANCAAKMEEEINKLPDVGSAHLDFAGARLLVETDATEDLRERIERICRGIEQDVRLEEKEQAQGGPEERPLSANLTFLLGVLVYAAALSEVTQAAFSPFLFLAAYLLLGGRIFLKAVRSLRAGFAFDENFLMTIATAGAFLIGERAEGVGVILFYRLGDFLEQHAVGKSRDRIMAAVDLRPETIRLLADGEIRVQPAAAGKVGDIIQVRPGDRIPLDGIIVAGEARVDTSPLTGEPVPVRAFPGSKVLSGSINLSGVLELKVEKELSDSAVSKILHSVENALLQKPKLDRMITRFAKAYTPAVVAAAFLLAVLPGYLTGNWEEWLYKALTFLVISCPCALVLSVPLTFFAGIGAASREAILFKSGAAVEMLARVGTVIMDKTGTLTEGSFIVRKINAAGKRQEIELLGLCAAVEDNSSHPLARSIVSEAGRQGLHPAKAEAVEETAGFGIRGIVAGCEVVCGSREFLARHRITAEPSADQHGGTEVFVAVGKEYAGSIILADAVKQDAALAVAELKKQGIFTAMLTGDEKARATAVGSCVGMDYVKARLLPEEKLQELESLRALKGHVLYVGDGINDAPALAAADVGAAIGRGVDAATEVADIVYLTDRVGAIPDSLKLARQTVLTAKENIAFALGVKAVVMLLGLAGTASMWLAVFADSGVTLLCVLNSLRLLKKYKAGKQS